MSRKRRSEPKRARSRQRLLYVINDLTVGGAQRALLSQAAGLDRDRYDVHVASLELLPEGSLTPEFEAAGITVHTLAKAGEPFGMGPLRLRARIAALQPDIAHTHLAAAGIVGRIAARSCGVHHVVSTLHNVSDWTERRAHPLRALDRATLKLADRICAVSDAVGLAVANVAPHLSARTLTVRNGVSLEEFRVSGQERENARARMGFAPADFVIATVARLEPYKGIETLLRAAAAAATKAPMLQLLVVGDGSDRPRLECLAESLGIAAWTTFTGTREDVPRMLASADIFAMPSHSEGLGVAAIEALAAGLPVLASRVGGLPEIIEDTVCGRLLRDNKVEDWIDALTAAAHRPPSLQRWRDAATKRAAEFSIESSVADLERLYDSLSTPEPPAKTTPARQEAA